MLHPQSQPQRSAFLGGDKAAVDTNRCTGCWECLRHCPFSAQTLEQGVCRVNPYACEGCGVCAYVCTEQAVALHQDVAGEKELYEEAGRSVFSTATLKMGRGNSGKLVTEVKLAMLKNAPDTQLAILDGSPGIGCPVIASVSGMDLVLVVAEPSLSGLSDLKRLVKTTQTFQTKLAVCVNKWDQSPQHTQQIKAFCQELDIQKELYAEAGRSVFSTATLKMGRGNSGKLVTEVKLAMLKNAPDTQLAILDGSPGIGCPVIASVSGMDLVLVVAEPSLSGLSDLKRLVKTAQTFQTKLQLAILDGSPGIGCPVIASVSGMDLVLVVAEPSLSGLSDLKRLVKTAQTFQTKLAVCVNKCRSAAWTWCWWWLSQVSPASAI